MKKYWWVLLIILVLPLIINLLIIIPRFFPIVGDGETWLIFWGTYIGAVVSAIMVFLTWQILKQNQDQLKTIQKQWDDENRPYLEIALVKHQYPYHLDIEIRNIGKHAAEDISFNVDPSYYQKIENESIRSGFLNLGTNPFKILPGEKKYICILHEEHNPFMYYVVGNPIERSEFEKLREVIMHPIRIEGTYNGKYRIMESLSMHSPQEKHYDLSEILTGVQWQLINISESIKELKPSEKE